MVDLACNYLLWSTLIFKWCRPFLLGKTNACNIPLVTLLSQCFLLRGYLNKHNSNAEVDCYLVRIHFNAPPVAVFCNCATYCFLHTSEQLSYHLVKLSLRPFDLQTRQVAYDDELQMETKSMKCLASLHHCNNVAWCNLLLLSLQFEFVFKPVSIIMLCSTPTVCVPFFPFFPHFRSTSLRPHCHHLTSYSHSST